MMRGSRRGLLAVGGGRVSLESSGVAVESGSSQLKKHDAIE